MPNAKQIKILSKLFKRSGRTFQQLAKEAGLKLVPDHVYEITETDAEQIINAHRGLLSV
jgi:hypothetical protein